jgi:hypothetical protein
LDGCGYRKRGWLNPNREFVSLKGKVRIPSINDKFRQIVISYWDDVAVARKLGLASGGKLSGAK